jgi:hypothetical protein
MEIGKEVTRGLKQADGLAPALFNSALQYATRKLSVGTRWTLQQILGYANDIDIMERSLRYIRGRFEASAIAREDVSWRVNEI